MFTNLKLGKKKVFSYLSEKKMCLYIRVCYEKSAAWLSGKNALLMANKIDTVVVYNLLALICSDL